MLKDNKTIKKYGVDNQNIVKSTLDKLTEEVFINGYTIIPEVLDKNQVQYYNKIIDNVYDKQVTEFGKQELSTIKELNTARCLLAYDESFIDLLILPVVVEFIKSILGDNYQLLLQNSTISHPSEEHHQMAWHRDLPYQDYTVSRPIALNVYFCLSNYNKKTGSTIVLPFSHHLESLPSDDYISKFETSLDARAGSIFIFNSFLYHRAGLNTSNIIRRGINHIYSIPIIKQQINLPSFLKGKYKDDPFLRKVLGYDWETPKSVLGWRNKRLKNK